MKKLISIISAAFLCALPSAAQYLVDNDGVSSIVMNFLAMPRDPSALASGGQYAIGGSEGYAAFSNPASVPFSENMVSASFSYGLWQPSMAAATTPYSAGFSFNVEDKAGISFCFATDPQKNPTVPSDEYGTRTSGPQPSTLLVGGGFSFRPVKVLSLGLGLRYANQSLVGDDMSAFVFDCYAMVHSGGFSLTAGARNLGQKIDGLYGIPSAAVAAASYEFRFGKSSLSFLGEFDYFLYGASRSCIGSRCSLMDMVSLGVGYNKGGESPLGDYISVGAGLSIPHLELDAAYLVSDGPLGGTMCFGLGINF